jgi:predicted N-acyltransferase
MRNKKIGKMWNGTEYLTRYFFKVLRKTMRTSVLLDDVPAEIRTEYLLNITCSGQSGE